MSNDYGKQPKSSYGLDTIGLGQNSRALWNLTPPELYEQAIVNEEAILTKDMALRVLTGSYTGRSPGDRCFVEDRETIEKIDWGGFNQPTSAELFDRMHRKMTDYLADKKIYVKDLYAGADPEYRINVRVVSEAAYHALFAHNMFIRPNKESLEDHKPGFTVLAAPNFRADPEEDGTRSGTFILCSFEKNLILIGGTLYSGEVKKGIFTVMNYLLPQRGVMPMHCSANMDHERRTALFFGLSGTGKTTLSSDTDRILIGDDEHGWSDQGVFNFEGGCYAKTIKLSEDDEPLIYATTKMPGTILENVILDDGRQPNFDDATLTENTRCAYPIHFIPNASVEGVGGHPEQIIFLTADAFGILPPVARLNREQTIYHFISGYTAKIAGTERGITEPQATFSTCFGAPFMPLHPKVYAELLTKKIEKHGSSVWLLNTGWTGGSFGTGNRIKLKHTRAMLSEIFRGGLDQVSYRVDPVFGLEVPESIDGVPSQLLRPRDTWSDPQAYDRKAAELSRMFTENYKRFDKM
ncbi:MAG: phosphoenolpyruvate carboxykinase (ATP) [Balneolaceae bacterium]